MKKFCLSIIFVVNLFAQESIPPYYWSWEYLFYLKSNGYLKSIDVNNRPLTRTQIAQALMEIEEKDINDNQLIQSMISLLKEEFQSEIDAQQEKYNLLGKIKNQFLIESQDVKVKIGAFAEFIDIKNTKNFKHQSNYRAHPQMGLNFNNKFLLYAKLNIFKKADTEYIGKEFQNHYAYVEQGYFSYQNHFLNIKLGRDFLQVGPGRTGQLLFSANSRTFDLYQVRIGPAYLNFNFYGIQLDKRRTIDSLQIYYSPFANRFINGHHLSFNWKNKYYGGIGEVVIYGGPNAHWELGFVNPFTVYYGYNVNGPYISSNQLYNVYWDLYLPYQTELYGEILIDDIQVEKKIPGDLEPDEIGMLVGFSWSDIFHFDGSYLNLEYVQIRNRTYNVQSNDWEKYLHRNKVIGYYLGNDFKLLSLSMEKWWRSSFKTGIFIQNILKGEGTVQGEFNTDYINYSVDQGYDESFPWGIVEKHFQYGITMFVKPHRLGHLYFNLANNHLKNYQHIQGKNHQEFSFTVGLWMQWRTGWRIAP